MNFWLMLFTFFTRLQMLLCGSDLKFHLQQVISNSISLRTGDWLRHCITALIWLQRLLSWFWVSKYFTAFMWIWGVSVELFSSEWIQLLLSSLSENSVFASYCPRCVLHRMLCARDGLQVLPTYLIFITVDPSFSWICLDFSDVFGKI